jgi:hypothetical protein
MPRFQTRRHSPCSNTDLELCVGKVECAGPDLGHGLEKGNGHSVGWRKQLKWVSLSFLFEVCRRWSRVASLWRLTNKDHCQSVKGTAQMPHFPRQSSLDGGLRGASKRHSGGARGHRHLVTSVGFDCCTWTAHAMGPPGARSSPTGGWWLTPLWNGRPLSFFPVLGERCYGVRQPLPFVAPPRSGEGTTFIVQASSSHRPCRGRACSRDSASPRPRSSVIRLLRVFRVVKVIKRLTELRRIVKALLSSVIPVSYSLLLLALCVLQPPPSRPRSTARALLA